MTVTECSSIAQLANKLSELPIDEFRNADIERLLRDSWHGRRNMIRFVSDISAYIGSNLFLPQASLEKLYIRLMLRFYSGPENLWDYYRLPSSYPDPSLFGRFDRNIYYSLKKKSQNLPHAAGLKPNSTKPKAVELGEEFIPHCISNSKHNLYQTIAGFMSSMEYYTMIFYAKYIAPVANRYAPLLSKAEKFNILEPEMSMEKGIKELNNLYIDILSSRDKLNQDELTGQQVASRKYSRIDPISYITTAWHQAEYLLRCKYPDSAEKVFLQLIPHEIDISLFSMAFGLDYHKIMSTSSTIPSPLNSLIENKEGMGHRGHPKINVEKVIQLRKEGFKQSEIAKTFGVTQQAVSKILKKAEPL